uniref:Saposin B-type domain-containing protein n=1 Tax=Rhabditophanes sp. KR3021 TaxID=114890 RepID=A0AC35U7X5_9BILA
MKYLAVLCVLALAASSFAIKDHLLKTNKIPMGDTDIFRTDVCDECQSIVSRFADAMNDPAKVETLKLLLRGLCKETSYELECKLFVNKLDVFMGKLLPYLKDSKKVCHKFHMCGNKDINTFHKLAILYADKYVGQLDAKSKFMCDECRFAANELENMITDRRTQAAIRQFISENICTKIPHYRGACDLFVDDVLPEFFQKLEELVHDAPRFCHQIGLCDAPAGNAISDESREAKHANGRKAIHQAKQQLASIRSQAHPDILMSCLECDIAVDALIIELKTQKSINGIATDLQTTACNILPTNFTLSCNDFLGLYAPPVVYLAVNQLTSNGICKGIFHACPADSSRKAFAALTLPQQESVKCEACEAVNSHIRTILQDTDFRSRIVDGIEGALCKPLPGFATGLCENLMQSYIPTLLDQLQWYLSMPNLCSKVFHLC